MLVPDLAARDHLVLSKKRGGEDRTSDEKFINVLDTRSGSTLLTDSLRDVMAIKADGTLMLKALSVEALQMLAMAINPAWVKAHKNADKIGRNDQQRYVSLSCFFIELTCAIRCF